MAKPNAGDKTHHTLHLDIKIEACLLRDDHLKSATAHAAARIRESLERVRLYQREERTDWSTQREPMRALHAIEARHRKNNHVLPRKMPSKTPPPQYDSWVPMHGYAKQNPEQPYLTYMGDSATDSKRAEDLFNCMCEEYERVTGAKIHPPSDGEFDDDGALQRLSPSTLIGHMSAAYSYTLKNIRLRAAQRFAVITLVSKHGDSQAVHTTLARALSLHHWRRAKLFYDTAVQRKAANEVRRARIDKMSDQNDEIRRALVRPTDTTSTPLTKHWPTTSGIRNSVQCPTACLYYCRQCALFSCDLHDGKHMTPRDPIHDPELDARFKELSEDRAKPCSRRCFLLADEDQQPRDMSEGRAWADDEVCLLREGFVMFERDACSLAVIIGSRSCRDVHERIERVEDQKWIDAAFKASKMQRTKAMPVAPGTAIATPKIQSTERVAQKSSKQRKQRETNKRAQFQGCDHLGECIDPAVKCPCKANDQYCQPRCGCNGARYCDHGMGVELDEKNDCWQTGVGCSCVGGTCSTETCSCIKFNVACIPGVCKCDSHLLPSEVKLHNRRCRNCDFIVGRHKKTFVGRSIVDGFGLFAGDDFEAGETVAVYYGAMLEEEHITAATLIGEERNRTYTFELTNDHSVDATLLGAKARFANHGMNQTQRNCSAMQLRIRGDECICLRTTRKVSKGTELLFDYKLTMEKEWMHEVK